MHSILPLYFLCHSLVKQTVSHSIISCICIPSGWSRNMNTDGPIVFLFWSQGWWPLLSNWSCTWSRSWNQYWIVFLPWECSCWSYVSLHYNMLPFVIPSHVLIFPPCKLCRNKICHKDPNNTLNLVMLLSCISWMNSL